ncbi:hypothetical protein CR513_11724, partial [Mucuna pruriens]
MHSIKKEKTLSYALIDYLGNNPESYGSRRTRSDQTFIVQRLKLNYWKQRIMAFFDACHIVIWDVVENGNYIPTNKEGAKIPRSSWKEEQKTRYLLNSKAINFLMSTLTESEYEKVHSCKSSKEMWDTLALAYKDNETIDLMFGIFQMIINNLISLGKTYDNYYHITKILRSLSRRWRP